MSSLQPGTPADLAFDKALFWDIQLDTLDLQTHARFIIERILTKGNMADWNLLKTIYGKEKIKDEVVRIRSLDKKTISFLSVYLGVNKRDFRCCS